MFAVVLAVAGFVAVRAINSQAELEARDRAVQLAQDAMSTAMKLDYDEVGFTADDIANATTEQPVVDQDGTTLALLPACYDDPATFTLPAGLDNPTLAGITQPRVVIPTDGDSELKPCIQSIRDVQDWGNSDPSTGREYTVITHITAETSVGDDGTVVTGKRITIESRWQVSNGQGTCINTDGTRSATEKCAYLTALRAPSANEQIPTGMGTNTGDVDACNIADPVFCRTYVTEGNVLAANPGPTGDYPLATPVQFFVETRTPVTVDHVSATIEFPRVDRGTTCGERTDGTALEYGFCGDGTPVTERVITIGEQTVNQPAGFRPVSVRADGTSTLFMAYIPDDTAATGNTTNTTLAGMIRPGLWDVTFTVDGTDHTQPARWSYIEPAPLTARAITCPAGPGYPLTFAVDGLSPNTTVFGPSRTHDGLGVDIFTPSPGQPAPNRSALDWMETRTTTWNPDTGEPSGLSITLPANKTTNPAWDATARTMTQQFTIPAAAITDTMYDPDTDQLRVKVTLTRAIDGITTTSVLSCARTFTTADAPLLLTATPGNTHVTLTWTAPRRDGGAPVNNYIVRYSADGGTTWTTATKPDGLTTTIQMTGLTNGTSYLFSVVAINTAGSSQPALATATPRSTPAAPTNLTAAPGNHRVTLTWTPPVNTGGAPILNYRIAYRTPGTATWTLWSHDPDPNPTATITGLTNGTLYEFKVAAINTAGVGEWSTPVTATPRTTPDAPTDLTAFPSIQEVILTWLPPAVNGGAPVTNYRIDYRLTGTTTWVTFPRTPTPTAVETVAGLTNNKSYDFRVAAINAAGTGAWSTTITASPTNQLAFRYSDKSLFPYQSHQHVITPVVSGDDTTKTFAITKGALPAGVTLNTATGTFTGPTETGWGFAANRPTAGSAFTCTLTPTDDVKCWGSNLYGQLGNNTNTNTSTPSTVIGLPPVSAIVAGGGHACALTIAGGVKCWGRNDSGQLGNGTTTNTKLPVDVTGLTTGVTQITAGSSFTCALTTAGAIKCWGANNAGQLGNGNSITSSTPVTVTGMTGNARTITAGSSSGHICAITTAGGLKCWGANASGQLGNGNTAASSVPVNVIGLTTGVTEVSPGGNHTCALTTSGGVKCWGQNNAGQLGNGTTTNSTTPTNVTGLTDARTIISASAFTCALTTSDAVKCWGVNNNNQLGNGTTTNSTTPTNVTADAVQIGVGSNHACVLTTTGGLKCWGANVNGQIGNGTTLNAKTPANVLTTGFPTGFPAVLTLTMTTADGVATAVTTLTTAPARPVNLTATPTTGGLTLTWNPPTLDGGTPVTNYTTQCRPTGTTQWVDTPRGPANSTPSQTVTGLTSGKPYECRVTAINAAGPGAWSIPTMQTTN